VREVRNGVRHWEAIDDGARLLLFDQLAPPAEIEKLAEERETAIVLTCPWHRRDAEALANRYGAPLCVRPPDEGLGLPVEIVLLTHGAPSDRAALERALALSPS
jgi:hypothetical protein